MREKDLATSLRINRGFIACHEVSNYGHRADVLSVDKNKRLIYEYEFKRNAQDLKVREFQKEKYRPYKVWKNGVNLKTHKWVHGYVTKDKLPTPHYFYFVVTEDLWEKEHIFLKGLNVGVMSFNEEKGFYVIKRAKRAVKNTQKFDRVFENICIRLSNLYSYGETLDEQTLQD